MISDEQKSRFPNYKLATRADGRPLNDEQWLRSMYEAAMFESDFETMERIKILWGLDR